MTNLIAKHGGYRNLKSFQTAEIVFDLTAEFCTKYIDRTNKSNRTNRTYATYTTNPSNKSNATYTTYESNTANKSYYVHNRQADQMLQAARSGKQNISEGSQTSGTSKKSEIRLVEVARASLEELKNDYEDFLRVHKLAIWSKDDPRVLAIRQLAYKSNKSYATYKTYMLDGESAANCLLCLINQASFLLDQQLRGLEKDLKEKGDFKDRFKNHQKRQILGDGFDFGAFLKSHGLRRLENGKVVEDE